MTEDTDSMPEQASREATDWLIRLQEAPEDIALRREFEAWRQQRSANAAAWAETQRVLAAMRQVQPRHARQWRPALDKLRDQTRAAHAPAAPAAPVSRARTQGRRPPLARRLTRGSAVAALLLMAVALGPDWLRAWQADFSTGTAETRALTLADGSRVTLAPESAIKIAYTPAGRDLRLLAGRAFFEVAPHAQRPFRVTAGAVDVTVLGTGFSMRRNAEGVGVAVQHGQVRVAHNSAVARVAEDLGVGEALRLSWAGQAERGAAPVEQIAAWREHWLIARDRPLAEVVDELRPYYSGKIIITSAALAAGAVTGVYNLNDPALALGAIARAHNAAVHRVTPWLIFISAS